MIFAVTMNFLQASYFLSFRIKRQYEAAMYKDPSEMPIYFINFSKIHTPLNCQQAHTKSGGYCAAALFPAKKFENKKKVDFAGGFDLLI